MLEIFDFPPLLHHFDAHSLWHAATIPLGMLWYEYWKADARYFGVGSSNKSVSSGGNVVVSSDAYFSTKKE